MMNEERCQNLKLNCESVRAVVVRPPHTTQHHSNDGASGRLRDA